MVNFSPQVHAASLDNWTVNPIDQSVGGIDRLSIHADAKALRPCGWDRKDAKISHKGQAEVNLNDDDDRSITEREFALPSDALF